MTVRRLFAVFSIFACTAIAWFILGASVTTRTTLSSLEGNQRMASLWGGRHIQFAPSLSYNRRRTVTEEVTEKDDDGNAVIREIRKERIERIPVMPATSLIDVQLALDHRRKGLLWYDTYTVEFVGRYRLEVPRRPTRSVGIDFQFPSPTALYDNFSLAVDGKQVTEVNDLSRGISATFPAQPGQNMLVEVRYRSRGLDTWSYRFAEQGIGQIRDFDLTLRTDFDRIDFPSGTLSPSRKRRADAGWELGWHFENLVTGQHIGLDLPNKLNPGPLTARITFFAPVSLLFFITVLVMLGALKHLELHPAHFFFLSAAFFSFHLLMAYLVDHVNVHIAFTAAAVVSLALVLSYLRLICGLRQALRYAGWTQLVFLVLFSYAFFFEGLTGLAVTIGSIITLFVLMQLTAGVDWERVFDSGKAPAPDLRPS